jgi:hypothetical protein
MEGILQALLACLARTHGLQAVEAQQWLEGQQAAALMVPTELSGSVGAPVTMVEAGAGATTAEAQHIRRAAVVDLALPTALTYLPGLG